MTKFKYFAITLDDALDSAGAGEGFIDPREATDEAFSGALPTTLALSRDKARANLRWKLIVDALKETGAVDVSDIVVTAGDEDSAPTAITFKVVYESDKLVHAYDLITDTSGATLVGPDGFGAGETETNAIERIIANALSVPVTKARVVYDPTLLAGKSTLTEKFEDLTAANLATGATPVIRQADLESPFALASVTVAVVSTGGYAIDDTLVVVGGTGSAANINVDEVIPVDAQTEANYDNVGDNGTFAGGASYQDGDIITLNDGTTVVVDTAAGAVTEFTVDTSTTLAGQSAAGTVLTQIAVIDAADPVGTGFTLTLDIDNQEPFSGTVSAVGSYTGVLPTSPNTPTGSSGGLNAATWNLVFGGLNISVTQLEI